MGYVVVVALSLLVGVAVYAATLRSGAQDARAAVGFDGGSGDASAEPVGSAGPEYTYLRVGIRGPSWQDRVIGIVGLVVLVSLASVVLALGIYQLGHIVNVTVERFLES